MTDLPISGLPAATTPLAGTETLPVVQGGVTDKVTVANLTAGRAVSALNFTATYGSAPASDPVLSATQTWVNGGVTYNALNINVTDSASASASTLAKLQVGGSDKFVVYKSGAVAINGATIGSDALAVTGSAAFSAGTSTAPGIHFPTATNGLFTAANYVGVASAATGGSSAMEWYSTTNRIAYLTGGATFVLQSGGVTAEVSPLSGVSILRGIGAGWQLGAADAAAPVAQTLTVQSVATGTSNTAGTNFTIAGSKGTGTGAGGSLIFQVAPAGSSGSAQNALATALTIDSTRLATFGGAVTATGNIGGTNYIGTSTSGGFYPGGVSRAFMYVTAADSLTISNAATTNTVAFTVGASNLLTLNGAATVNGATAIPAGGANTLGLKATSTANFGVFFGSGVPSLSAAKGSLYLRSDGSTTNDRMYVNTDGGTTWTAVITAA